ncbi:16S rRNA (cytosine(1402)-N(4))-methyltransferase RsmH [Aestuariivirga sp. YIM B02566]|uniref:16S rRNA (Cytosine(1402)-N(4))-methyltransferase RsmH n=1 Tax=Taklimakanibacter albus TaxID=2800327 RepID=A0ACC5QYJ1_9HYPH|nr:16S rRNA (cytosine(1402)-N(4))-methyltransferase RsmH [Aestuariivirga sp. YIM B02566]
MASPLPSADARHRPVMLAEVLSALTPRDGGIYIDGTFGAGGYTRAILGAADCKVLAIDRDPDAIRGGAPLAAAFPDRLTLVEGRFSDMEDLAQGSGITMIDGAALDIGVSSMQIDEAERGFSFAKDGPLDMRMEQSGPSAADVVNQAEADHLTRIIGILGEERKARPIAHAIVKARAEAPILTTFALVRAVERAIGRQRPQDRIHPATRTFQALRIYVNRELEELGYALAAAERLLKPGGRLAVVTFHSLEDRIVKRFFAERSGKLPSPSRHMPGRGEGEEARFIPVFRGHQEASEAETAENPRARSAKLRAGERTAAPALPLNLEDIAVPSVEGRRN